ncbi:MAG: hypothetical protein K2R98_28145 [Gemmataceae bacterium]|nr:hypothetical protein [Gemmataceae bacterium]
MAGDPFTFGQPAAAGAAPAFGSTIPVRTRHPLGLPQGSVRALLTIMVIGTLWALLLMPPEKVMSVEKGGGIPLYLYYLTFLIIGSYFSHRSTTPKGSGERHPLYLPRGSIRFLLIVGFIAVIGLGFYKDHDFFEKLRLNDVNEQPFLPFIIFGAFFVGIVFNSLMHMILAGPNGMPAWYQDVLAWVSVLAVLGLTAEVVYQLVIVPNTENPMDLPKWQSILSGVIAFYFGVRS